MKATPFVLPALGVLWMTTGCGTRVIEADEIQSEAVPSTPSAWMAEANSATRDLPSEATWAFVEADPVLGGLVREAWEHNRELRTAAANLRKAAAEARLAGADRQPQLSGTAEAQRQRDMLTLQTESGFGLGLNLSWEVDLWGRLGDEAAAAGANLRASQADFEAARRSLAGQVVQRWYELVAARALTELAEETLNNWERNETVVRQRYTAGLGNALEVRLARTSTRTAASAVASARQREEGLQRALEALVGRYPAGELESITKLPAVPELPGLSLPSEVVATRPDLQAAAARYESAALAAGAARKLRWPRLTLTGTVGTAARDLEALRAGGVGFWSLVGGVSAPLWDGGRITAQADRAAAQEEAALAALGETILRVFTEVETGLAADARGAEQVRLQEQVLVEARAAEALAGERYRDGLTELPVWLESQRQAVAAAQGWIEAQREHWRNRVTLLLAVGSAPWDGSPPEALKTTTD